MATNATTYEKGKLYELPISSVQPDPEQPRKFFDEQALAELSASITSHGVLQPILVREGVDGVFIIVSGERRYADKRLRVVQHRQQLYEKPFQLLQYVLPIHIVRP